MQPDEDTAWSSQSIRSEAAEHSDKCTAQMMGRGDGDEGSLIARGRSAWSPEMLQ
jgi:hypothetical protein